MARQGAKGLAVWRNVYRRIRFFRKMYPLRALAEDALLLPLDYLRPGKPVSRVRNLTVAITHRCNIKCEMCYFHEELSDRRQLPLELFKRIVDRLAPWRPCLILSGGEPCTHPDLVAMVAHGKARGLAVQIFSNGTLFKPELTDALVGLGLDYVNFSLLGDPQTHELVARVPGSYQRFRDNLEYLAAHRGGTRVMLNYTITPWGLEGLSHGAQLARALKLDGLRVQHFNFLEPREFKAQEALMCRLFDMEARTHEIVSPPELGDLAERVLEAQARLERDYPDLSVQWAPTLTPEETRNWYSHEAFRSTRKCLYPWRGMLVDADGCLYPCSKIYLKLGDLDQDDPWQAFNSLAMLRFRRQLKKGLLPACSRCCKL